MAATPFTTYRKMGAALKRNLLKRLLVAIKTDIDGCLILLPDHCKKFVRYLRSAVLLPIRGSDPEAIQELIGSRDPDRLNRNDMIKIEENFDLCFLAHTGGLSIKDGKLPKRHHKIS